MEDLLPRLQRKTIEKFCLCIITRNNYIVIVFTSTGMVMFSQNLLNTIGTWKRSDRPKQEITCECWERENVQPDVNDGTCMHYLNNLYALSQYLFAVIRLLLFTACFLLHHVDYIWESFLWVTRQWSTRWWQPLCTITMTLFNYFKQRGIFLDTHTIQ